MNNFWQNIKKPIIGLAPMDGITDAAFRYIIAKYGKPDVIYTEFYPVDGVIHKRAKDHFNFKRYEKNTKTVIQFFGSSPVNFYKAARLAQKLGYDGIDINMGCPDRTVMKKGGGAALISNSKLAQEIIEETKRGAGRLPVSVKTRIGEDKKLTEKWATILLETNLDVISIHGRSLSQIFAGPVKWDELAMIAKLAEKTKTIILGNGSVKSVTEVKEKCQKYGLGGILIGRAAFGNPWIFADKVPTTKERFQIMIEHCEKFLKFNPKGHFASLRKHLAWYCKGFEGAAQMREKLMHVNNLEEVRGIMSGF